MEPSRHLPLSKTKAAYEKILSAAGIFIPSGITMPSDGCISKTPWLDSHQSSAKGKLPEGGGRMVWLNACLPSSTALSPYQESTT